MSTEKHNIDQILVDMQDRLCAFLDKSDITEPLLIGIHTGGLWVAEHTRQTLGINSPLGELNIAFYRDDFCFYSSKKFHLDEATMDSVVYLDERFR